MKVLLVIGIIASVCLITVGILNILDKKEIPTYKLEFPPKSLELYCGDDIQWTVIHPEFENITIVIYKKHDWKKARISMFNKKLSREQIKRIIGED